ncbi:hypothetical protein KFE25_010041 [Diacronema lutheri]|uniref:Calcyclin-binding protein n=2 Tax=Diacronema lutheri TaxID=2081491 RepID=A0A8J5XDC4_DIALT|nr:hypothetical protein KFE25_010041 [Diacronema lutheri]
MAGGGDVERISSDLVECRALLQRAETDRARALLRKELAALENEHRTAFSQPPSGAPPAGGRVPAPGDHRITTYAWDQTGKYVKLYITVAGVDALPEDAVACAFESRALDLRIRGVEGKEKYLLIRPLCDEIEPADSSFSVKSDRVLIKLCKKSAGAQWGSVDDSDLREKERKEEKAKASQGKSTAQLLSELYGEADDDAKKKLEEAWEKGRQKREGRSAEN